MATIALIKEAVAALKERDGSSVQAISKWIESEKKVSLSFRGETEGTSPLKIILT